ncbi:MAG: hypothetical protein ACYTER_03285 [Planctomycetota bacterium]|jgi:uncharacterized protein YqgC (DUF456 family)
MSEKPKQPGMLTRLSRALGPIAGGLILDFVDLATLGPIGLVVGPFLGFATGFWICSAYRFSIWTKISLSLLAGLYCMIPMTGPLPLATLVAACCRFFEQTSKRTENDRTEPPRKHVDSKTVD